MKFGVVGLPNVGKSTLFNSITNAGAEAANYPFCTIEPNVGIAPVPDERLTVLTNLYKAKSTVPAAIEFVDIAGIVKGASKGEGLGNKFLSHIREVDAIIHVVRCFENENIIHVNNKIDPAGDAEVINLELILADIESVDRQLDKLVTKIKAQDKTAIEAKEALIKIKATLEKGQMAILTPLTDKETELAKSFFLLSFKPILYVANVSEEDLKKDDKDVPLVSQLIKFAETTSSAVIKISARIEEELNSLDKEEQQMFLEELGLSERALNKLINASYKLLGLISYLTAGEKEVRAWTIKNGTKAPQAAAVIHTDFERGFIKAEVVAYADLIREGSIAKAKEKGLVRFEGKEYVVKDGDVITFKFNV